MKEEGPAEAGMPRAARVAALETEAAEGPPRVPFAMTTGPVRAVVVRWLAAAEQLGFSTRGMRLDYDTLRSMPMPCVVHWQGYHYVVVHDMSRRNVWVADPAIGLRKYKRKHYRTSASCSCSVSA